VLQQAQRSGWMVQGSCCRLRLLQAPHRKQNPLDRQGGASKLLHTGTAAKEGGCKLACRHQSCDSDCSLCCELNPHGAAARFEVVGECDAP
jgi:hypothetical protein